MTASIRVARESDAKDIATLTGQLGYDVSPTAARHRLSRILRRTDQQFFIAEFDGRAVGCTNAETQYSFVKSVDPSRQVDLSQFVPRLDPQPR